MIDVRLMLPTDGGAAIGMTCEGLAHADAAMMDRFRHRELLSFDQVHVRTEEGPVYHVFAIR